MRSADPQRDLLVIAATSGELGQLFSADESGTSGVGPLTAARAHVRGARCRLVIGGIGPVNTSVALTRAFEATLPAAVLQIGIAGAYVGAGLEVGRVACATEEIYGDLGVLTSDGPQPVDLIGIPVVPGDPPRFNRFPLDRSLVDRLSAVTGARSGPFLTLSMCTGVRGVGDQLFERFGAICESMEGAAAAHVCALYGVPFLELRGISNLVVDRDRPSWRIVEACAAVQDAALRWIETVWSEGKERP